MRVPKGDTWAVWLQNIRAFAGSHVRYMTNAQRIEGYTEAQFSPLTGRWFCVGAYNISAARFH